MHPTPQETIDSVVVLLERSVAPSIEDSFASVMLRACISALKRLQDRLPDEFLRMVADCHAICTLAVELGDELPDELSRRIGLIEGRLVEMSFEPAAIQAVHEDSRQWLVDCIDVFAQNEGSSDALKQVHRHIAAYAEDAGRGFNLTL